MREGNRRRAFPAKHDMIVCGEAADVAEALALVETTIPDVVVIDISLKEGDGIDLIKRIRTRDSSIRMLVCSMHPDSTVRRAIVRAGASRLHQQGQHDRAHSSRRSGPCATVRST